MKLQGKNVLITGASSGLGEQISYAFAKEGATVFLVARRMDLLKKVEVQCKQLNGGNAFSYKMDVTNVQQVDHVLQEIGQKVKGIDILVNNAGFGIFEEFLDVTFEDVQRMFEVNVLGLMYLTQGVSKNMVNQCKGHIFSVASIAGKIATPKSSVYSATKFAVLGFSNSLRLELKPYNIQVTTVNPGPMQTDFFDLADPSGNYLKSVSSFLTNPEKLAQKIVKSVSKPKREINQPILMSIAAKAYTLFPVIGDFLAGGLLNKK